VTITSKICNIISTIRTIILGYNRSFAPLVAFLKSYCMLFSNHSAPPAGNATWRMQQTIPLPRPVVLESSSSRLRNPVLLQYVAGFVQLYRAGEWRWVETIAKLRISVTRVKHNTVYTLLTLVLLLCFI
jgi:hypothetical protein